MPLQCAEGAATQLQPVNGGRRAKIGNQDESEGAGTPNKESIPYPPVKIHGTLFVEFLFPESFRECVVGFKRKIPCFCFVLCKKMSSRLCALHFMSTRLPKQKAKQAQHSTAPTFQTTQAPRQLVN
jgi:hypothetical protein